MQQPIATNDANLFFILKENQYFDRKSARKDDKEIAKHISAFANSAGGKLVIGIEDDGEVFLRQNDRSVRLNREQVLALEYDKGQRVFEDELVEDCSAIRSTRSPEGRRSS